MINDGKLALVLGVEVSEVLDCGQFNGDRRSATAAQIDRELDELHALGVQSLFPVHKFDNALGGTHFDDGSDRASLVNAGNKYATGQFWQRRHCDDARPRQRADQRRRADQAALVPRCSARLTSAGCSAGSCRSIRPGRCATRKGLTAARRAPDPPDDGAGA